MEGLLNPINPLIYTKIIQTSTPHPRPISQFLFAIYSN